MPSDRGSRVRSFCGRVSLLVAVAACATSCGGDRQVTQSAQFCAIMADSIGLYVNNPVTQMGYKIGTIDSITPADSSVEVRFTIKENRPIPSDVRAVTRSLSILADRSLELVGNYKSGPRLSASHCIPRDRTATPLSISQVIGSATNFVNGINPDGSANIKDALLGVDQALHGNGASLNKLLRTSSSLLDSPDQAIADMGAIVRNLTQLTAMVKDSRAPLKEILLDMPVTQDYVVRATTGVTGLPPSVQPLILLVEDLEVVLGDDIQVALDTVADALRHLSPHYKGIANLLNPVPRFINTFSYYLNNHQFDLLAWSPPVFRVRTPDGLALCGAMNAAYHGSCADVNGTPYAVDVSLLQYVLMEASRR